MNRPKSWVEVVVFCDNCSKQVEAFGDRTPLGETKATMVMDGMTWDLGGGYGSFLDSWDLKSKVTLCHDCVALVFKTLPGVGRHFADQLQSTGWHGCPADDHHAHEPDKSECCCEFSW